MWCYHGVLGYWMRRMPDTVLFSSSLLQNMRFNHRFLKIQLKYVKCSVFFSWWSWCLFFSQPHYFWWLVLSDTIPKWVKHLSWESLEVCLVAWKQDIRNFCDFPIWDAVQFHCHVDLPKGTVYNYLPYLAVLSWKLMAESSLGQKKCFLICSVRR